jgi:DNA-binding response OmpR family regulator
LLLAAVLTDEGYKAILAADADEGELLARELRPALILLDLLLPGGGSLQFLERYRTDVASPAPVVVMTAASDHVSDELRAIAHGVLLKPFELDDLIATARRLCPTE